MQGGLDGCEFRRKGQQARQRAFSLQARQLRHAHGAQPLVEFVEMVVEQGDQVVAARRVIGNRRAPDAVPLIPVEIEEEVMKTRDQVDLGNKT